jgi:hypothetical protein
MTLPSLYRDYKKYLDMEKDPTKGHVDISHMNFIAPASLLPAISFAESNGIANYHCSDTDTHNHLNKILKRAPRTSDVLPLLDVDLDKNYEKRDICLNKLKNDIHELLFPASPFPAGIDYSYYGGTETFPYIIEQIIDNIEEHSNAERVYSYSQKYPKEGYIDVGILDNGDTIPKKFEQSKNNFNNEKSNPYEVQNDCEAIFRSLNGISTGEIFKTSRSIRMSESEADILKSEALSLGINSSIRLITEGLGGSFLIASRGGICHLTKRRKQFINSNEDPFDGTFICIRFNKRFLTLDQYEKIARSYSKIDDEYGRFKLIRRT